MNAFFFHFPHLWLGYFGIKNICLEKQSFLASFQIILYIIYLNSENFK